jgi:hypothetical protein
MYREHRVTGEEDSLTLAEAIRVAHLGDEILLEPGDYYLPENFVLGGGSLVVDGLGPTPEDTVIYGNLIGNESLLIVLRNVTIVSNTLPVLDFRNKARFILINSIILGESDEKAPVIYLENSNSHFQQISLLGGKQSVEICHHSNVKASYSRLPQVFIHDSASLEYLGPNTIEDSLAIVNDSSVSCSNELKLMGQDCQPFTIYMDGASQLKTAVLNITTNELTGSIDESELFVKDYCLINEDFEDQVIYKNAQVNKIELRTEFF